MDEEDMEMEEGEIIEVYDVVEVDLDYEYDAARFFDFTTPESEAQARLSEDWFYSAPNYPPSPFVAKLFPTEGLYSQNVSPKGKYDSVPMMNDDADINQDSHYFYQDKGYRGQSMGLSFYDHMANDLKKTKSKSLAKPYMPRNSTLMKPTASQLAKQNQRRAVDSRLQKSEDNSSLCGIENQASKRQKLDGGVLRRIVDVKQPSILTHKMPKKDFAVQVTNTQSKLRITIPREPDLETAHRAERIRSTSNKEVDKPTAITSRYKARSLNKKILEAPVRPIPSRSAPHVQDFQPSRFKTSEHTKQLASTVTETSLYQTGKGSSKARAARTLGTGNKDGNRSDSVDAPMMGESQAAYRFKARPLDRKILTSRGDLGVFRNSKREVTVPKEFEFHTAKRNQQNPPVELFSKLSLAGEPQPKSCAQPQLPQRNFTCSKGSKENRWQSCRQDQNMKLQTKRTQDIHSDKQILHTSNGAVGGVDPENGMTRTGTIWRQ